MTVFNPAPGGGISNAQTFTIHMNNDELFSDDFTRPPDSTDPLLPWVASMGTWTVTDGVLQGTGARNQYSYAYVSETPQWTDYTVQGSIQMPAGSFGGRHRRACRSGHGRPLWRMDLPGDQSLETCGSSGAGRT